MTSLLAILVGVAISAGGAFACTFKEKDFEALREADSIFVASVNDRYRSFQSRQYWDLTTIETIRGREEPEWNVEDNRSRSMLTLFQDEMSRAEQSLNKDVRLIFAVRISEQWALRNFDIVLGAETLEAPCGREFVFYDTASARSLIERALAEGGN